MIATIIANYNYGKYVIDAINSALNQSYKDHIVIVVDDGSTDGSMDLINKHFPPQSMIMMSLDDSNVATMIYEHNNLFVTQIKNSGASVARNVAIQIAIRKGAEAVHILDADDYVAPNKVQVLYDKMKQYPEIGVVYADYMIERPEYSKIEYKPSYNMHHLNQECIVHSGSLISIKYLKQVSKGNEFYNPSLHGPGSQSFIGCTEDYELWLRLSRVCVIVHEPSILTFVREHGSNQSMKMNGKIFQENVERFNV